MVKQYIKLLTPFIISRQEVKKDSPILPLFLILFLLGWSGWGQTSTQNFGTGAATQTSQTASTSFIPAPTSGTTYSRAGATAPAAPIVLANTTNLLGGTGSYVRAVASATSSVCKFSPWVSYTGGTEFYTSFKVMFGDSAGGTTATSGIWSFFQGAGAMYSDANNFSSAQVFSGLFFTYGTGGSIALTYRLAGATVNTGLTQTAFSSGTIYNVEIIGNNKTSGTINYTYNGNSRSVAVQKFDLYINGTLIGDDLGEATLPANTAINAGTFIGLSSTGNVANVFVDDAVTYNAVPSVIGTPPTSPTIALADNGTQVAAADVSRGTQNVILNKIQLGVSVADATLTGMSCTTTGTYAAADVSNLRVRYSADANLTDTTTDPILSTLANPGVAGSKTFTSFTSKTITNGSTGYLFITADVSATATHNNTIAVSAIGSSNLTVSGTPTYSPAVSTTAGGAQTFKDVTAPTVTTLSPANGATAVARNSNLVLTFSENVKAGTAGSIDIYDAANVLFESIPYNSGLISFAGATATINPTNDLAYSATYHVLISATAITDANDVAFAGFASNTDWSFTTLDQPPVNNACATATALAVGTTNSAGTFFGATADYGASRDVWYSFTPTCSGTHTITVNFVGGGNANADFEVYATTCPTSTTGRLQLYSPLDAVFTNIANSTSGSDEIAELQTATVGTTYYIRVIDPSDEVTTFDITVSTTVSPTITLDNTGTPAAGNIAAGATNVVLLGFNLTTSACNNVFYFQDAIFYQGGTHSVSDFENLRLVYDANANGLPDPMELASAVSQNWTSNDPITVFWEQNIMAGASNRFLLVVDVKSTAVGGHTFYANLDYYDITVQGGSISGTAVANVLTITAASITLADNGTQTGAANILRGTNNTVISKAKLTVGGQTASVTQIQFVTAGSSGAYVQADIASNGFKLWRSASSSTLDTNTDTLLGSVSSSKGATATNNDTLTFAVSESLPIGDYYYWLTVDVASSATPPHTITVNGLTNVSVTSAGTTITGSTSAAGSQTIVAPTLTVADNSQVTAQNVFVGSTNNIVSKAQLTPSIANVDITAIDFVSGGTYTATDIATGGFELFVTTSNTFSTATPFGTAKSSVTGAGEMLSFTNNMTLTAGTTYYFWLTANVSATAALGNIVNFAGLSGSSVTSTTVGLFKTGTTSASGNQTIIDNAPSLGTAPASVDAPFSITLSPDNSNYRGAITSVKIGATSLAFTTSPGNITLDPADVSNTLLRTPGSKTIDITATNYTVAQVSQVMLVGATAKLAIATALAAPTTNGGLFATQPVISYRDKYDNPTTSTETVRATKLDAGAWTLGGTTDITPSSASSSAAFTNLTATSAAAVSNAQIRFSLPNVSGSSTVDSATFTLIAPDFISIATLGVAVTENFDGMASSATATLPTGFKVGAASPTFTTGTSATTVAYGTTGTGVVTSSSGGGTVNWANGITASSTDRALGFITTGSFTSPRSIMAKFKNTSAGTINNLAISFDYEKYRSGSRAFDWTFYQSNDGSTWTAVTAGDQSYAADAGNTVVSNPPLSTAKSFSITGLNLASGGIIYLRWAYTGVGGSTNGQGLAVDNFSITGTACAPVAASVAAVSTPICSGSVASFTLNGTAGTVINYTLNGNSGNATVLAGGSVTVTTGAVTTNQTLTLNSASLSGCSNAVSGSATVVVNPYPVPDSIADVTQCGGTFTLPTLTVGTYYTGSGATGSVLTAGTVISSSQTIYVYASNAPSCSAEDPFTITINELPIVTASDVSGCSGTPISLIGSGTPSGGSGNFSVANPYVGTTSTTYTYTYTAPNGCSATSTPANITITAQPQWFLDADGDHYYTGTAVPSCTSPGSGYTTSGLLGGGDCDDNNAAINPGATEICYNNIDDNCNTTLSEGCAPVVVNMTASYNNTTLASLSTAIPAVTYSYAPYTNLKYRFSITNVTTGAAPVEITQASRYVTIPASLHLYGAAYDIKVSAVINDEVVPYAGNTIRVNAPTVQLITLSSGNCGATLASLTSTLSANPGLNATGYTFRIRVNDANPSPTYAFSQSGTRFINANSFTGFPLQYSSSYKVSVQYSFIDPVTTLTVQSGYGAECVVNTPGMPLINIASPTCGSQVSAMNANISSGVAAYSTAYQFRIRLFNDNGPTPTYYYTNPNASRFSSLAAFQGITLAYNTPYSISVQYSVLNGSTTVWSGYGPECKVTTPFFPVTSLVPSQCGLTASTPLTQQLNITPYPGFPHYMVKLEEVSGETVVNSQEIEIAYSYFRLNQFSIAQEGKNYAVSVKIKLNGVFGDYDTACDLHTPQPNEGGNNEGGGIVKAIMPFKAIAYPNPFANNFMLDVRTSSQSNVTLKVYDMIGRLIEQRIVTVSDMGTTTIGANYPTGVYNVVVSQEDCTETLRVVKR